MKIFMNEVIMTKENKENKKKNYFQNFFSLFKEIVAIFFWSYSFIQVFFFDLDMFFIRLLPPNFIWVVKYKFFILIAIVVIVWVFTKNKKIIPWFVFIIFYPLIFILWKIPKLVFRTRSWVVAIACINLIVLFFSSIKYKFIISSLCLISICLIITSSNKIVISFSVATIFMALTIIFINRFVLVFKPSPLYKNHSNLIGFLINHNKESWLLEKEIKELTIDQMNDNQIQKWSTNLQMSVIANRLCLFLSTKLREYQKSKTQIIFDILNLLWLVLIMIFFFAFINMGLYKINHSFYGINEIPSLFLFLYYSLNGLYSNIIPEINATSNIARGVFMLEVAFSFILILLLITLIFSIKNERDSSEMENAIEKIKKQGEEVGNFISSEYNLSVEQAILELEKVKVVLIKFIYYLSKNI